MKRKLIDNTMKVNELTKKTKVSVLNLLFLLLLDVEYVLLTNNANFVIAAGNC